MYLQVSKILDVLDLELFAAGSGDEVNCNATSWVQMWIFKSFYSEIFLYAWAFIILFGHPALSPTLVTQQTVSCIKWVPLGVEMVGLIF